MFYYLYIICERGSLYGKYGICKESNPSRIFSGQTYFKNEIEIKNLYKIEETENYKWHKPYDKIISIIGKDKQKIKIVEKELNKKLPKLNQLNQYLINEGGGTELFYTKGLKQLNDFIRSELELFDLSVTELSKEEIDIIIEEFKRKKKENENNDNEFLKRLFGNCNDELNLYIKPRGEHQEYLYNNLHIFQEKKIGQLIWCCGLGKTFMSLMICYKLGCKKILICVPSIYLLEQFKNSIEKAFQLDTINIYNGSENSHKIKDLGKKNICIVLSTYHSCNKVLEQTIKNNFKFDIKIGDEAHHLVTSMKKDDKISFDKFHKIKSVYTLFMTATQKEIINKKSNVYTMSDREQFGPIIDDKNVDWAIKNNCITNYNIVCIMNSLEEIKDIYKSIDFEVLCKKKITYSKKELFFAAYNTLKSLDEGFVSHLLIYTNRQDTADIVEKIINNLLDKNIFDNLKKDNIYNKSLHSGSNIDLKTEVNKFEESQMGIISCVYIFGEGFDLPKLNGVVIGEQMTSDIRIVQSCLRPNRLEKDNENKKAYIIIPTNINNVDTKIKTVINQMIKEDENIVHKIKFFKTSKFKRNKKELFNKKVNIENCKETLARLKLHLCNNGCFGNNISLDTQYKYNKELLKEMNFKTVQEYLNKDFQDKIKDADSHFYKIWINWFDYLSIDTSKWIKNKNDMIKYCKENNITNTKEYYANISNHACLPSEPQYLYNNFTNLINELGYRRYIYIRR